MAHARNDNGYFKHKRIAEAFAWFHEKKKDQQLADQAWKKCVDTICKCDQCEKLFATAKNLWDHKNQVHRGYCFECEKCSKTFKTKKVLSNHDRAVHLRLNYKCEQCDQEFKSRKSYFQHKKQMHQNTNLT